ncbi:uncharacterized protein LOC118205053 [Stegodyphus dumicola]|uniref:uncharacterized protein LOC118205053 n=1 Tax=Stegodyphus dumicola TaxID=202533 RepID=UPI0015A8166A|nr:uncharacterized protein LOC118205053 [Stegodyphus dumicola]
MNAQAIANAAGTVSVNFMQAMYQEHMKYPFYKHYPIFKTEVTVLANYAADEKDISDIVTDITDIIAVVEDLIQTAENTLCVHYKSQSSSGTENPACVLESDQCVEKTYMEMNKENIFDVSKMLSGIVDIVENTVLYDEKKKENDHSFLNNQNVLDTCRGMNPEKIDDISSVENTVVDIAKTCTSFLKNSLLDVIYTKAVQSPNIVNLSDLEGRDSSVSALLQSSSDLHSSGFNSEERFDNRNETVSSCSIIPLSNSNNILNSNDSSLVQTSQHSLCSNVCSVGTSVSQTELSGHISETNNSSVVYHGNQLTYIKNSNLGIKFSNDDENVSENETDTDDESDSMSVDRYSLEQSSSFSDDSLLSECSLTSNSSECSSEYDSGVSDISSSPNVEQVPHSVSNGCSSHSVDVQIVLKSVNNECTRSHEDIPENALPKIRTQTECFTSLDEYSKKSPVAVTTEMNELSVGIDGYSHDSISGASNDQESVHAALIKACEKKSDNVLCEENAELNAVLPKCSESTQHNSVVNTSAESEHLSNLLTAEISMCKTGDTQTDCDLTHSKQLYITDCLPYEKIGTNYGLIFKDMDLSSSAVSSPEVDDDTDSFAFDQFHLSSLNTVAWNQNYGCHYYLLSAGSSGIARISCLSGICSEKGKSMASDAHIM